MSLILPYEFAGVGLKTPTSQLDANFQAVAEWLNGHGGVVGLIGARPAPTSVGAIYVASDQQDLWYMADGTAWHPIGRAGDGVIDVDPDTGNVRLWGAAVGTGARSVLACGPANGHPPSVPGGATLYVLDTQGVDGRAAWHQVTEDFWTHPLDRVLHRLVVPTPITVVNTVADTSLFSVGLQGRTLGLAGLGAAQPRGVEVTLGLDAFNNSAGSRTLTLRVKYGGLVMLTAVLTLANSGTRRKGALVYRLDPVSGNVIIPSEVCFQWEPPPTETLTVNTPVVDITATQTLEITAQMNFASTLFDVRLWSALVRLA
jgi:hypothetical protein